MQNLKRLFTKTNIIIFGVVFVLPMLYIAYDVIRSSYFGAEIGEACTEPTDCKGSGAWCMKAADGKSSYCTHGCGSDQYCPASWTCGDSGYVSQLKFSSGATGAKKGVNVCWKDRKVPMSR